MKNADIDQKRAEILAFIEMKFNPEVAELSKKGHLFPLNNLNIVKAEAAWHRGDLAEVIPYLSFYLDQSKRSMGERDSLSEDAGERLENDLKWGNLIDHFAEEILQPSPVSLVDTTETVVTPGTAIVLVVADGDDGGHGHVRLIEALAIPGSGGLIIAEGKETPRLTIESAMIAHSLILHHSERFGIDVCLTDVHLDISKIGNGPSAGVAIFLALLSSLTSQPVGLLGATGSLTLRGKVGVVGGVAEKVKGAFMNGIFRVIIPKGNESDLRYVPLPILKKMDIIPVSTIDEAIAAASVMNGLTNKGKEG